MAELLKKMNNKNNNNGKSKNAWISPKSENLKVDGQHPLEYIKTAIMMWLKQNPNGKLPVPNVNHCARWWLTSMQPCVAIADNPLSELIFQRQYLLHFLDLDAESREMIAEAAAIGFYYRGDDLDLFREAYSRFAVMSTGRCAQDPLRRDRQAG